MFPPSIKGHHCLYCRLRYEASTINHLCIELSISAHVAPDSLVLICSLIQLGVSSLLACFLWFWLVGLGSSLDYYSGVFQAFRASCISFPFVFKQKIVC